MRALAALALLLVLCMAGVLRAADVTVPRRVDIEFAVYLGSMRIGEGRDHFEQDGKSYRISSESKTVGIAALYRLNIAREVQGRVTPAGLRPQTYTETRNGKLGACEQLDVMAHAPSSTTSPRRWSSSPPHEDRRR